MESAESRVPMRPGGLRCPGRPPPLPKLLPLPAPTPPPPSPSRGAALRVPSKRVAMVSRKVFCGASNPFITGMVPPGRPPGAAPTGPGTAAAVPGPLRGFGPNAAG